MTQVDNEVRAKIGPEARAVHLARGFLRGVPYSSIERKCYTKPRWDRVEALIGDQTIGANKQRFADWRGEAELSGAYRPRDPALPGVKVTITLRGILFSAISTAAKAHGLTLTREIIERLDRPPG